MDKLSVRDLPLKGKRVLVRTDFNVPIDSSGAITSDARLVASLPTLRALLSGGASLVLMSHLGRPKGRPVKELSLHPVAKRLSQLLGKEVLMAPDCIGDATEEMAKKLLPGQIMLLENLRFHPAEEKPSEDPNFAKKLASLGDLYVNDAFGTSHRSHSSTVAITSLFPGRSAAGLLLEKEIEFLGEAVRKPKKPFYALIGGAKVSTKIGVLKSLLEKVDALFIGGAMAYTFLKAEGKEIGDSLSEEELLGEAKKVIEGAKERGTKLFLPLDSIIVQDISEKAERKSRATEEGIPKGWRGVDIGEKTIDLFKRELQNAKTLIWNGPLGIFEIAPFSRGTVEIAKFIATLQATTIVGGGDSASALHSLNLAESVTHLSTGGGAALEYIEYGTLPAIEALSKAPSAAHF